MRSALPQRCNNTDDYDLSAKGDLVRARLTIKSSGLRILLQVMRRSEAGLRKPSAKYRTCAEGFFFYETLSVQILAQCGSRRHPKQG